MENSSPTTKPKRVPGPDVIVRFFKPVWWEHVWRFSWQFKRYLYVPAAIFLFAGLVSVPSAQTLVAVGNMGNEVHDAGPFLVQMGMVMLGMATAGIASIIGMGLGVYRLAVFTRAFLLFPLPATSAELKTPEYRERVEANQKSAFQVLSKNKGYLAQIWLLAALIMIPTIFVFCGSSFWCVLLTMPPQSGITLPTEYKPVAIVAAIISFIVLSNYSIITVAMSSMKNLEVGKLIGQSLILLFTTAPLLTALSVVIFILNTAIGTPYVVPQLFTGNPFGANGNLPVALFWEAWQVATGIMLFPLSTALLSEALRDCIQLDTVPVD